MNKLLVTKNADSALRQYVKETDLKGYLTKAFETFGWYTGLGVYHSQNDKDSSYIATSIGDLKNIVE